MNRAEAMIVKAYRDVEKMAQTKVKLLNISIRELENLKGIHEQIFRDLSSHNSDYSFSRKNKTLLKKSMIWAQGRLFTMEKQLEDVRSEVKYWEMKIDDVKEWKKNHKYK